MYRDEFTSFCIHTGLVGAGDAALSLNSYFIEYRQDMNIVDQTLASHAAVTNMRYFRELSRIMVTREKDSGAYLFDDFLNNVSYLKPAEVLSIDGKLDNIKTKDELSVTDVVYVPFKDLYCYAASDHTINFCREHCNSGRQKPHFSMYHRIYHAYLHVKLCWSEQSKLLCSVDSGLLSTTQHINFIFIAFTNLFNVLTKI